MRIRGQQEMSAAQNQLLLNGKVFLPKSLPNENDHHPQLIPQYGFPFDILPNNEDRYPISIIPNLNSLPERTTSGGINGLTCTPSTPVTLDKNKRIQDRLIPEVIDIVDDSETDGNMLRNEIPMLQPSAEKPMGLFFSNLVMSSHIVSPLPNEGENNLAMPSGNASLQQLETEEHERRENQGIDLNKTPQQKPRRKKHRPKVIREGKSAKTPKSVTPKPVTPKPPRNNASPNSSGKRKYVRKKKVDNSLDNVIYPSCEILDPNSARGTKSARRCLNFNSEEPQARNGQPGSLMFACNPELQAQGAEELQARNERPEPLIFARNVQTQDTEDSQARNERPGSLMFTSNAELKVQGVVEPQVRNGWTEPLMFARNVHTQDAEESQARIRHPGSLMFGRNAELQAQDTPVSGIFTSSRNKSAMSSAQGREVVAENSPERIGLNINRLINQVPNEYIRIPQTPTQHSQPSRREAIKMDHMLKGHIRVAKIPTPPPQPSRREILQENLKAFARMNGYMNIAANSDKSLTGQKTQVDANDTPDVLLSGTKRHHNHVDESHAHINFSRAYNGINEINECHVTSRGGPHFPQIQKKMRTEEQSELASNASSVTSNPSGRWEQNLVMRHNREVLASADTQRQMTTTWKTGLMVPNNCEVFTFADAQRVMAFEKLRTSERMLSFAQREVQTSQIVKVPVLNKDGFNNMNCSQLSPEKVSRCNVSQGSQPCGPQICIEASAATNPPKIKTKSCNKREQIRLGKPMSANTKKTPLQEYEAAVFSYGSSHAQKSAQLTASASKNFRDKNTSLPVSSVQDCQSSSNFKESRSDISMSGAIVPYGDPVDDLVRKLKCLNITVGNEIVRAEPQNALVPYGGGGSMMVPYEGPFDPIKKRRPRPKVDLDEETNRVWKVLMGKESTDEAIDMDKEKWWEEERRIVHGRVDSFIARMHLVQGDRRFSKWKGSVVDSVVGVFLTQNVSDHLSSSAYMNLAARFPLKQNGNNSKPNPEKMSGFTEQQEGCIITFDDDIKWKENMLGKELYPRGPFVIPEAEHTAERETTSSNEQVGSNTNGSVIDYSNGIGLDAHERELEIGHESHDNRADTSVTVTGSTSAAEAEDRISTEDVVSSQNSVISSQNSSECLNQTAEKVKLSSLSNWDMEDITNGSMGSGLDNSTSFMELLQMAETTSFQELYSHGNGRMNSMEYGGEVGNRKSTSDLRGKCSSMYRSNSHPREIQHDFMGLSCAPSPSFTFQNSLNSRSMAMGNINEVREVSSSHVHSTVSGANITNNFEKMSRNSPPSEARSSEFVGQHNFMGGAYAASSLFHLHNSYARLMAMGKVSTSREETSSHLPSTASGLNTTNSFKIASGRCGPVVENSTEAMGQHDFMGVSSAPSPSYHHHNFSNGRLDNVNAEREESSSHLPSSTLGMSAADKIKTMGERFCPLTESTTEFLGPQVPLSTSRRKPVLDTPACKNSVQPLSSSKTEVRGDNHSCCHGDLQKEVTESSSGKNTTYQYSHSQDERTDTFQQKERGIEFQANGTEHAVSAQVQLQSGRVHQTFSSSHNNSKETFEVAKAVESNLTDEAYGSKNASIAMANGGPKAKKVKAEAQKKKTYDWDTLRKQACPNGAKRERSSDAMDSVDWEALRTAHVNVISHTIRERGMNNMLAERIKEFLDRIVKDHGSIDLEWLRDVPPDRAKDYLLSIRGLGLKSVECVRLLTLHHLAFPVDTNVGRICVRLGWVPLQPLPESLQLHLLEMYPVLETIQKYLWPRLCKLDQRTLYELHYQMITFGKVFCTKSKPNCNACPMRAECRHFASAFASSRFTLPGPEEKGLVNSAVPISSETRHAPVLNPMLLPQLEGGTPSQGALINNCEPIIEEPASPESEYMENSKTAIEDAFYEDPDEIPTINLNLEEFTQTVNKYMHENNMELQDGDISKALVAISPDAASIPVPKLKNVSRLRTEHQVYELPDSHPLLEGLDRREPDDPCSYFLAIWSPGETARSIEPPKVCCNSQDTGTLCDKNECFTCNSLRESQSQTVRGTLLIPCRTAMRGSFPLNGTYFQVNEVFADHDSSLNPIYVSRQCIWNLPRRTVYFGTSIPTIFKGLTTEGIQQCFWRGFVCVRGFDRRTRAPKPLYARLHFPASKTTRNKKAAAAAAAATTVPAPERDDE